MSNVSTYSADVCNGANAIGMLGTSAFGTFVGRAIVACVSCLTAILTDVSTVFRFMRFTAYKAFYGAIRIIVLAAANTASYGTS